VRRSAAWLELCREFGVRLRQLRAERQIAASELAAAVGVANGTVLAWERGRVPGPLWLLACAIALGCTLIDLLPERAHHR
jgi:DNA-binding XRE family transcriptional regulator